MHVFGDIFRYQESEYVFLGSNGELIFVAKILNSETTKKIKLLDQHRASQEKTYVKTNTNPLFYYVTLSTEPFKDCCAHVNEPDKDSDIDSYFDWIGLSLNEIDRKALKEEIIRDGSPVSGALKKILKDI